VEANVTYKHVNNLNKDESFRVFSRARLPYLFPPRGHLRIQGDAQRVHQGVLQTRILTTVRAIMADLPFLMHFSDSYHAHSTHLLIIIP